MGLGVPVDFMEAQIPQTLCIGIGMNGFLAKRAHIAQGWFKAWGLQEYFGAWGKISSLPRLVSGVQVFKQCIHLVLTEVVSWEC